MSCSAGPMLSVGGGAEVWLGDPLMCSLLMIIIIRQLCCKRCIQKYVPR